MLRAHRSLESLLCNPMRKVMKMTRFFMLFHFNGAPVEWNWQGKTEVLGEKTCPSTTLSTTNYTWNDPGSNPGLTSERPATNGLSHGTAPIRHKIMALTHTHSQVYIGLSSRLLMSFVRDFVFDAGSSEQIFTSDMLKKKRYSWLW
jgi:hypothetical protein